MNSTIIFLSILILFLSVLLCFRIKITLDLNNNELIVFISLYKIRLLKISVSIIGLFYTINDSKKIKPLRVILKSEDKYLIKQIKASIIDKLYYDDIVLISKIGLNRASDTAIIIGLCNYICHLLSNTVIKKNLDTRLYYNNLPDFEKNNLYIDCELKVYFTIFDLLFAIIMSFYKRGKYVKENKNKQRQH